jgi:hypothetical protein
MRIAMVAGAACAVAHTAAAGGPAFVESFTGGSNEGGWTYGSPNGAIEGAGGNPGAYFHDDFLDTFAPQPRTGFNVASLFTGNLRAQEVVSIGIDLILFDVDFSAGDRPLTLMLVHDRGTPANFDDDWAMYTMGPDVPLVGEGWKPYDFAVPTELISTAPPPGWSYLALGGSSPPSGSWNALVTDVAQVRYFYGDPTFFFIFQAWDLGMDNPRLGYANDCPADFDETGDVGFSDLTALLLEWGPCAPACPWDLDESGDVGFGDLTVLLLAWGPC